MGSWRIVAVFIIAAGCGAGWRMARGGTLLLSGTGLLSFSLLLSAGLLGDAALFPGDLKSLPVPLALAIAAAAISILFRRLHLLAGLEAARGESKLEECGIGMGLDGIREGSRLVFKRQGAAVERVLQMPGFALLRLDRRRAEPAVDRLMREWRRSLAGGSRSRR